MKNKYIKFPLAALAAFLFSCNPITPQPEPEPEPVPDPVPEPQPEYTDLSKAGTANCYVIDAAGEYRFDAGVCGNGKGADGLDAPKGLEGDAADVIWQSAKGMISGVRLEDGFIYFTASDAPGNALLKLTKGTEIIWSWHIWHPEAAVEAVATSAGYSVMNMNLGAMAASASDPQKAYGLLYQWGRKDPFPGSPSVTGDVSTMPAAVYDMDGKSVEIQHTAWNSTSDCNMTFAISHPTWVISNGGQFAVCRDWLAQDQSNDALWGNPKGEGRGSKTYHDPCPQGWMVPDCAVFADATQSGGYEEDPSRFNVVDVNGDGMVSRDDFNYGWTLYVDKAGGKSLYFPATGRYDGQYAMLYGSVAGLWGNYWSNAPYASTGLGRAILSFQAGSMSPNAGGSKADAYSIRCVRSE